MSPWKSGEKIYFTDILMKLCCLIMNTVFRNYRCWVVQLQYVLLGFFNFCRNFSGFKALRTFFTHLCLWSHLLFSYLLLCLYKLIDYFIYIRNLINNCTSVLFYYCIICKNIINWGEVIIEYISQSCLNFPILSILFGKLGISKCF